MIKAAAGGGGRGIRRVDEPDELENALNTSRREAQDAFGDGTVFMEAMVGNAHHIEVQLIADGQGTAWAARRARLLVPAPPPEGRRGVRQPRAAPEQEEEVKEASRRLALQSGYRNAGTVEFLYEPEHERFSFMEVNARLQVEHPVTEAVTGLDLVKLQLHVAAGGARRASRPRPIGHAIEARLNAEDPAMGFAPTPGRVQLLDLASGPGIRIDRGIATGDVIPPDFDSMVAKVIAHGRDRDEAIARLRRALRESTAMIEDGTTNRAFLLALLDRPEFRSRRGRHQLARPARRVGRDGVLGRRRRRAAAGGDRALRRRDRHRPGELLRLRPPRPPAGRRRRSRAPSRSATAARPTAIVVSQLAPGRYRAEVDGTAVDADVERLSAHERRITLGGRTHRTLISRQGADLLVEVHGVPHRDRARRRRLRALARARRGGRHPGRRGRRGGRGRRRRDRRVDEDGDVADRAVRRPRAPRPVGHERAGRRADAAAAARGHRGRGGRAGAERVAFSAGERPRTTPRTALERLRWMLLGYDVTRRRDAPRAGHAAPRRRRREGEHRAARPVRRRARDHPRRATTSSSELQHSPQEYLHAFLRSLDAKAERLPERFVGAARSARSPTTASRAWTARRRWRTPATGCSSPSSAPTSPARR